MALSHLASAEKPAQRWADGLNQTGGMKTICFFDKAAGFDENLRKHPSALQTGDHYVLRSDLNMPGMSVTTHIEGGNTVPDRMEPERSHALRLHKYY
jgi:hypothetical protein